MSNLLFNPSEGEAEAISQADGMTPDFASFKRIAPEAPSLPLDPDLAEKFSELRGADDLMKLLRRQIEIQQEERNAKKGRLAELSPIAVRRELAKEQIAARKAGNEDRHYIHSVVALCGFPYRRPPQEQQHFMRQYGKSSLVVQAGFLQDPSNGRMEPQGLPYGPKARLMMLQICTMAIRQQTSQIEVADSMSAFMRQLGYEVTGGARGTIAQFKEQLHRLAAARMQIGCWYGEKATTINTQPIEAFDIWLPRDPNQKALWSSTIHLDQRFFKSLKEHALPVDIRVLRALANSAKQIDIVLWLGYRLRSVKRPYTLTWATLKEQFGSEMTGRPRKFKETFAEDIRTILEVFPSLPVKLTEEGMKLVPFDAQDLFVAPKPRLAAPRRSSET